MVVVGGGGGGGCKLWAVWKVGQQGVNNSAVHEATFENAASSSSLNTLTSCFNAQNFIYTYFSFKIN